MKISVIIPFMAGGHFLRECLESLMEQNFKDYEVIIVLDRCSEDLSWLEEEFQGKIEYRIIELTGKQGVAAARNLGLSEARGEYVYFLDSDDYIYEEALATLLECAEMNDSQIVYGKKYSTWYKRSVFLPTFNEQLEMNRVDIEAASGEIDAGSSSDSGEESDTNSDSDSEDDNDVNDDSDIKDKQEDGLLAEKSRKKAFKHLWSLKKRFKNISTLHILIKREFLQKNEIKFNENFIYYSDAPFVLQLLDKGEFFSRCVESKYIKRKHNDPINFPALSQIKDENRFGELIAVYYHCVDLVDKGSMSREKLDKKIIAYYAGYFVRKFRRSENDAWKNERFAIMHELSKVLEDSTVRRLRIYSRSLIKALRKNDLKKSIKIANRHMARRKFFRMFRKKHELAKYFYRHRYLKKPILKNTILFESFFGKGYSDNPKNLFEYINEKYPGKYNCVWVLNKKTKLPYPAKRVKRLSLRYMYYLACSKYFIFNVKQPVWFKKRKEMVFLETWHGTPLKRLAFDVEEVFGASPKHKKQIYTASRKWDYLVAANRFSSEIFRRCFMYDGKMLEYGYPRNDILHRENREAVAAQIRSRLNISPNRKTILYAPTWREDEFYGHGSYKFTLKLDLELMRKKLGDDYAVLVRTHYYVADEIDLSNLEGFAYNLCKYDDIAELYLISDIIITDYSSVFFDYANLKRPMLFYTYDLERYRDVLRGFYIDIEEELPGPLLFTTDEVIDAVQNIDKVTDEYREKYEAFYEKFCGWEDGRASENIINEVFK